MKSKVQKYDRPALLFLVPAFPMHQNYPNPVKPVSVIHFDISAPSVASIMIYSILGQKLFTFPDQKQLHRGNMKNYLTQ